MNIINRFTNDSSDLSHNGLGNLIDMNNRILWFSYIFYNCYSLLFVSTFIFYNLLLICILLSIET